MPSIGKYEILEQLGSGSMGTVYRGRDTLLDRMVAIKTIRTGVNIELEAKERFYREARTCARLNHPHIVAVFDLGEENGTSYIAMELLKGADFRQLIERREPLTTATKLIAMAQVCEGLAHAHREGVIHRDIKPSNLFLLEDGRAKVVDFGIARLPTSHLTRAGAVLGTPNYMAPEQIQGAPCDGRADLFSAAIVFFEFLTFQHPFKSTLIPQRILEDNPDSLFQYDPKLPRILEKIFARALAKKPDQRYATGDEFASDLRAVVDAMAMNSSPSFSRVELPSQSSFAVPPPIPPSETAQSRAGSGVLGTGSGGPGTSGTHDWHGARVAQLVPDFEEHIARRDAAGARSILAEIQSVAGADPRYREALENCRRGLAEIEGGAPGREAATASQTAVGQKCPKCGAANRSHSVFCIGCGAALGAGLGAGLGTGLGAAAGSGTKSTGASAPLPPPPPIPLGVKAAGGKAGLTSDKKRLAVVAVIIVIAAALLIVAPGYFRTVKQEQYVATARVASQQGTLLAGPSDSEKSVATVQRGRQVNVLVLPGSLSAEWVRVQVRDGNSYTRPGYLKAGNLSEWDSKDPNTALALARMSGPMDAGTDAEIRAQIDKLNSVAAQFSGRPAAGEASLDAARLEFVLARRTKDINPAGAEWQTSLNDLIARLEPLQRNPALQSGADDLLKQIREMMGTPPMANKEVPGQTAAPAIPGQPITPPTESEIKGWLESAEKYRKDYDYKAAKYLVKRVLDADPKNTDAQVLLKKINAAIELERSGQ